VLVDIDKLREVLDVSIEIISDEELTAVGVSIDEALLPLLKPDEDHETHENCREAALGMAVQVWQSRHAPGGQMVGADLNIVQTPHLLGAGLVSRFTGLLTPCMPYGGAVIA
jgi:hypothetical protein